MPEAEARMFIYVSELLGRPVQDASGARLGRITDLKVRMGELFPPVHALVIRRARDRRAWVLDWKSLDGFRQEDRVLKAGAGATLERLAVEAAEILLREDLLDKQVVDTLGSKIERVNDIHLLVVEAELRLVHVDFGLRGLLRRLGWLRAIDRITAWLFAYRLRDRLVSWKYVQPLASDPKADLKLNVTLRKLQALHPSDIADIIEELNRHQRTAVFRALDKETAAETLQEVDPKLQLSLIETASPEVASDILEEMEPDEATDLLADLPEEKKRQLIGTMEAPFREQVESLLRFKEGTAGSIMTTDFLALPKDKTVGDAVEAFRQVVHPLETVAYIYVTDDDGRPAGVVTLRHLLLCGREEGLGALMNPHLIKVSAEDDVEAVAAVFNKYKLIAVPVVDRDGRLRGIITLQDIIQATAEEL